MDSDYAYFCTPYDEVMAFAGDWANDMPEDVDGSRPGYRMGKKSDGSYYVSYMDGKAYFFDSTMCLYQIVANGLTVCRLHADGAG